MQGKIKKKTVVITGAAGGLGAALVAEYLERGWAVVGADFNVAELEYLRSLHPAALLALVECDVTRPDSVTALVEKTTAFSSRIDLVFNNAGTQSASLTLTASPAEWRRVVDVNLMGPINVCTAFYHVMARQDFRSRFVNIASLNCFVGPNVPKGLYGFSKCALFEFSEEYACALRRAKAPIDVTAVFPGYIKTKLFERLPKGGSAEEQENIRSRSEIMAKTGLAADYVAGRIADQVERGLSRIFPG